MLRVFALRKGSICAVVTSGSNIMSDSWIDWNPRTEDPSNARPSSNTSWLKADAGIEKCCWTPGRSLNRMSTYSMFSSAMYLMTSSAVVNATLVLLKSLQPSDVG